MAGTGITITMVTMITGILTTHIMIIMGTIQTDIHTRVIPREGIRGTILNLIPIIIIYHEERTHQEIIHGMK